ncbi:hypothetical protein [Vulcanococcus limneticus]|uniref:hypothetical protein n=1 Tax=Vulcanococcus limneticus TaxID=2170428 RepID=UPI00398C1C89
MDASISEVRETITLKRDGSRVSLEGVLTGSALGLFLVYLTEDSLEKAAQLFDWGESSHPSGTGGPAPALAPPVAGKPSGPIAVTESTKLIPADSAPIQPLVGGGISSQGPAFVTLGGSSAGSNQAGAAILGQESVDASLPPLAAGGVSEGGVDDAAVAAGPLSDGSAPLLGLESLPLNVGGGTATDFGLGPTLPLSSLGFAGGPSTEPAPVAVIRGTPGPLAFSSPSVIDGPQARQFLLSDSTLPVVPELPQVPPPPPKVLLVQVSSELGAVAQSPIGDASAVNAFNQVAITDSVLDLRGSDIDHLKIQSDRHITTSSISELGAAALNLVAEGIGVNGSQLFTGDKTELVVIDVRDLIDISVKSQAGLVSQLVSRTVGLQDSTVNGGSGLESFRVQALSGLRFQAIGDLEKADLSFDLITKAVNNSSIFTGDNDNIVEITSGFAQVPSATEDQAQVLALQPTLNLQLIDSVPEPAAKDGDPVPSPGHVSLNAAAIGLDQSLLDTGAGNDTVVISTILSPSLVDTNPTEVLQSLDFDINLVSIGLLRSEVLLGSGNDRLSVGGATVDTLIDLGDGNNLASLAGSVAGDTVVRAGEGLSTVVLGDNTNQLSLDMSGSLLLKGGTKSDLITLLQDPTSGYLDGASGSDLLRVATDPAKPLAVTVTGANSSTVGSVTVQNVESLVLGDGNDKVRMGQQAKLDGVLVGGAGKDLIDYSSFTTPVMVDLDAGTATGVLGGIAGIEGVLGGKGNDKISFSASAQVVDGGAGNDLLVLNWNPWTTTATQGVKILGGAGRDLFVFAGLDTSVPPPSWNGSSGLPTFADLKLVNSASGIGLTDRIAKSTTVVGAGGAVTTIVQELTPSGISGIGDTRLLPIAPLDQLLSGSSSLQDSSQLAIAFDPASAQGPSFIEIGSLGGSLWSRQIASIANSSPLSSLSGLGGPPFNLV